MAKGPKKHFVNEKRFLLSWEDLERVEKLVRALRRASGSTVQLSQLVRASLIALQAARPELERMVAKSEFIPRPQFTDTKGLLKFEKDLAKLLRRAMIASARRTKQRA